MDLNFKCYQSVIFCTKCDFEFNDPINELGLESKEFICPSCGSKFKLNVEMTTEVYYILEDLN